MTTKCTGNRFCECPAHTRERVEAYDARVQAMWSPRMPTSPDQVVPVRAHFRRQPNYARRFPKFRALVVERIEGMIEDEG